MTKEEIEQGVARLRAEAGIVMHDCAGGCGKQIAAHEYECYECQGKRRNRQGGTMGHSGMAAARRRQR